MDIMSQNRRTFLKTVSATSVGAAVITSTSTSAAAETEFSPDDLDGLVGWYDATELSLEDGKSVETWTDESTAGNDAWQDDGDHQPSYSEDGFAGIGPSVQFDGETDYFWAPLGDDVLGDLSEGEIIALLDPSDTEDISHLWLASPDIDDATSGWLSSSHNTSFTINDGEAAFALGKENGNEDVIIGGSVESGPNLLGGHWDESEVKLRIDGVEIVRDEYEASGDPDDRTVIGAPAGGSERLFEGDIAELLYFDRELSAADRQRLEEYLLAKWLPFVDVHEPTNVTPGSATLRGELPTLGEASSVEGYFEYRPISDSEWTTTERQTLEEPSEFSHEVDGLTPETSYEYRAVVESDAWGEISSLTVGFETQMVELYDPTNVTANSATVRGELLTLGTADSAEVYAEYREVPQSEWVATDERKTLTEPGEFSIEADGLSHRRIYDHRVVVETDTYGTVTSDDDLLVTGSASTRGSAANGPSSKSAFEPDDGFAEPAPWLDDETPIIKITEPTREQLERAVNVDHERLVAFETSGVIDLNAQTLKIPNDKCYVAGQTAPSPGITLIRGGFYVEADDCVVQHIRVRPGDAGQDVGWEPDAINTADDTENNVIDHCTATWGIDENLSVGYDTVNTTLSNCLIAEPLDDATHSKGTHGYGTLVGNRAENVAILGSVYAYNVDRNPRLKQGTETVLVNNLVHHYKDGAWMDPDTIASIEGNVFEWPQSDQPNVFGDGDAYATDNVLNWDAEREMIGDGITELEERPLWPDGLEPMPSDQTRSHNLANVGARPADRTEHDQRILSNIRATDGEQIDSQNEVGGYPDLEENTHELNIPNSGTAAWLRSWSRRVEVGNA